MPSSDLARDRLGGIGLVAVSASSFGVMPILSKYAYDDGTEPVGLLVVRFTVAAAVLGGIVAVRRLPRPPRRALLSLLLLGGVGYLLQSLAYFEALTRTSASLVALLLYLYPALVVVLSALAFRERPSRLTAGCVVASLVGTALTIGPVGGGETGGVVLGALAALAYAVYVITSARVVRSLHPLTAGTWVITGAAVSYLLLAAVRRPQLPPTTDAWAATLAVGLLCTVVAMVTLFAGFRRLAATDASVVSTIEPVVTVALATLLLDERLTALQLAGGVVVLAAVVVLARGAGRRPELAAEPGATVASP